MLRLNRLFLYRSQYETPRELISHLKVLPGGVAGYMGLFALFTQLLAMLHTTKAHPVMIQYSSIDSELVIVL